MRCERLPAALTEHVGELRERPQLIRNRYEQQLHPHAMERGTKYTVRALEQQGGQQPSADCHARRAQGHERRQHPQRPIHAENAQQP